jgi:hypothetical protein
LIHYTGITGKKLASMIEIIIHTLKDNGILSSALVMDGCSSNLAACRQLGYSLNPDNPIVKREFDGHPTYLFIDYCHCIKNIRNCLASKHILLDGDGNELQWKYVEMLYKVQKEEGLHLANKLNLEHIEHERQKMKVYPAVQVGQNRYNRPIYMHYKLFIENNRYFPSLSLTL